MSKVFYLLRIFNLVSVVTKALRALNNNNNGIRAGLRKTGSLAFS